MNDHLRMEGQGSEASPCPSSFAMPPVQGAIHPPPVHIHRLTSGNGLRVPLYRQCLPPLCIHHCMDETTSIGFGSTLLLSSVDPDYDSPMEPLLIPVAFNLLGYQEDCCLYQTLPKLTISARQALPLLIVHDRLFFICCLVFSVLRMFLSLSFVSGSMKFLSSPTLCKLLPQQQ